MMSSVKRAIAPLVRNHSFVPLILAIVIALGGVAAAAIDEGQPVKYPAPGGNEIGLRPTGVGLPRIGESSTVGASELATALVKYHDSGQYESDLTSVDAAAQSYLEAHLPTATPKRRSCSTSTRPRCPTTPACSPAASPPRAP